MRLEYREQTLVIFRDLPEPKEDTLYVVCGLVLAAAKASGRTDVIAPLQTGHPEVRRNEAGIRLLYLFLVSFANEHQGGGKKLNAPCES
jgi:hypothetical protein